MVVVAGEALPPASDTVTVAIDVESVGEVERSGMLLPDPGSDRRVDPPAPLICATGDVSRDGVMVRVLGPVEVTGWLEPPNRRVVTELACFLALHPDRNMTGEELRAALWSGDLGTSEASAKSLRNAISMLRKALGNDLVPEAQRGSGYRLAAGGACDWTMFSDLVASTQPDETDRLRQALSLVRGAPFEGVAPDTFTWAWTELFVSRMEVAIVSAAKRLGELALVDNDIELSVWAVLQGLSASPYDRALWSAYLNASAQSGRDALERSWTSALAVLGSDSQGLAQVVEELRAATGFVS